MELLARYKVLLNIAVNNESDDTASAKIDDVLAKLRADREKRKQDMLDESKRKMERRMAQQKMQKTKRPAKQDDNADSSDGDVFSRISSVSEDDVEISFSPVLKEPTTLINSMIVLFALWINPLAPDVEPVTFAPTVVPPDGIPDIVSLVVIRMSKR